MNAPVPKPEPAGAAPAGAVTEALTLPAFVHLKVHSAYSLLEGALPIPQLAKLAGKLDYPALGLTDTNNLFGILEFSEKLAGAGIQPIAGVSLAVDFEEPRPERTQPGPAPRVLPHRDGLVAFLAMSELGYANIMELVSIAHLKAGDIEGPHVKAGDLERYCKGLIVLTGGPDGPIDRALRDGNAEVAQKRLKRLMGWYGDRLYVEIQRHGLKHEAMVEPQLIELAYGGQLPLVATNEAYFASPDDHEAHDALLCIAEGRYVVEDDRRQLTAEHYFKSSSEMVKLFADLPEALENTVEIARRCAFRPRGRKPILPAFVKVDEGASAEDREAAEALEMKRQAEEGLAQRLEVHPLAEGFSREDYEKRLAYEIDIITRMKFPGYFLIVSDFIKWSKANGVPVGPGRGSGAGSLVAWALTITDLDPLRFGLLFERFLNPERVSMPDFDIDFCQEKRERTIRYVQEKYGRDRVAQIITHGKLQARAVLRDVGRVLQMPFGQVGKLCALVPNNPAKPVTLAEAIEGEPRLQEARDEDPMVARLIEISLKLEGLYRHASTHAAGMVIGDRPLSQLVPMYRDPKSDMPVTQFNWKMVEAAGLVKFDFLGLKTLTVLEKAVELVRKGRGIDIDLSRVRIENDYPEANRAYDLLAKADTVGVFQLESTGMRDALKKLRPDRFEDIIAMVALYRPGPMDNIPTYINRKHGEEPVDCLHPMLESILKETYGVIIYQEQVMQIAQVMAGYSLGDADLLRRAMGKKDKNEMARQQARFVDGAKKNGVTEKDAVFIFELVDKFAGYGFNKSHAAAYALVSFHTAYLKANFREEFLAASMTLDMANTDKLAKFAAEARKSGIEVLAPCVNASVVEFGVERDRVGGSAGAEREQSAEIYGAIRYALAALKNVGEAAVSTIVEEREKAGPYKDLSDFARRLNVKAVNKRALETLATAGAFDALEPNRALCHGNVENMMALANRLAQSEATGIADLFGGGGGGQAPRMDVKPVRNFTPMQRLEKEYEAVGFYLSGHPLDEYSVSLAAMGVKTYAELEASAEAGASSARLAAMVISARERTSAKGKKFAFGMFSDATGQFEAIVFSETLAASRELLSSGKAVLLSVVAESDGESLKVRVEGIEALDSAVAKVQRSLEIMLDPALLAEGQWRAAVQELRGALQPGRGAVKLVVHVPGEQSEAVVPLPGMYDISPAGRGMLSTIPGVIGVFDG